MQLELFNTTPIHRQADPETSREGAEHVERVLTEMQGRMVGAFAVSRTANEAALECVSLFGGSHETYRKRKGELEKLGLIHCVGRRKCRVTGSSAEVFQLRGAS